jgi:hypothetical protein
MGTLLVRAWTQLWTVLQAESRMKVLSSSELFLVTERIVSALGSTTLPHGEFPRDITRPIPGMIQQQ